MKHSRANTAEYAWLHVMMATFILVGAYGPPVFLWGMLANGLYYALLRYSTCSLAYHFCSVPFSMPRPMFGAV